MSYAARLSLSVTAVLVFSTVVQMVFGELAPKNLAIARTVPLARSLSRSTLVYLTVAGPVVRLFDRSSTALLRKVGIEPVEELEQGATAEDLTRIIDESHAGGLLDDDLSDVLEGGLRFRELEAGDVMTPRVRVTTIHADAPVSTLVALLDTGWSRFPVTGRDGDDIVGVAGIAEVLAVEPTLRSTTTVGSVVSDPTVVPTSAPLPRVLEQIRADHRQLAVVVDEHGGFAGIVTFEDIAEEVVGEILDEDDTPEPGVDQAGTDTWIVPGHLRLDELDTATELRLASSDAYSTISGLILEDLGRTAALGDEVLVEARREVVADGHHGDHGHHGHHGSVGEGSLVRAGATDASDEHEDLGDHGGREKEREREHEKEHRYVAVSVRLTVEAVERHVPSRVRVDVLDLLSDLEALDTGSGDDTGDTGDTGEPAPAGGGTDLTTDSRTEAGR
jgi:CBS domain containing-hemolysin-like protein